MMKIRLATEDDYCIYKPRDLGGPDRVTGGKSLKPSLVGVQLIINGMPATGVLLSKVNSPFRLYEATKPEEL